jgi:hypothetical protein
MSDRTLAWLAFGLSVIGFSLSLASVILKANGM